MKKKNPINESGKKMETLRKEFLVKHSIPFKKGKSKTIDFEIFTTPTIWLECANQNSGGSVMDKIPTKILKYHIKRGVTEIYIERGNKKLSKDVLNCIDWIETKSDIKVHILTSNEVDNLLLGFQTPKNEFFNLDISK